jgi:hypothetical protein
MITQGLVTFLKLNNENLKVKLAGGAAAQCIALMNSVYLEKKLSKKFQLHYFPHSTGTYWPFAIDFLLKPGELASSEELINGFKPSSSLEVGKIIRAHPLAKSGINYEKVLSWVRKLRLERILQKLRGESALLASMKNLEKVSTRTKAVSGGFVPFFNESVNLEMDNRFMIAGKKSPFSLTIDQGSRPDVVIHYRIGDKRAKFSHPSDFGGDGICDPAGFKQLIQQFASNDLQKIIVVSDEPQVAAELLQEVGVRVDTNLIKGDVWEDLYLMSQAKIFIGSWSQVSQLAAICVAGNGGRALLPSTTQVGTRIKWSIPSVEFYKPQFLEEGHWIYSESFTLDRDAHTSYKKE